MEINSLEHLSEDFSLINQEYIKEISGQVTVFEHQKSKAIVIVMDTEDDNKSFSVGFQTLPSNDQGVFHIIEHSIMNGSDKYRMQGLFSKLISSSLSNYVNAMTFDDKTVYSFASTNETDYMNLMDVYLDMVFNPIFLKDSSVFLKEGWHYESAERNANILGGVVYNEMLGAFSSIDTELEYYVKKQMFPDTPYGYFSGGHPESIPELTLEECVKQYRRFYCSDNCVIVLYGKLDYAEKMNYMSEKFLNHLLPKNNGPAQIRFQDPIIYIDLNKKSNLAESGNTIGAIGYGIKQMDLHQRIWGLYVLADVLLSGNQSPLKKLLLEQQLIQDITWEIKKDMKQPYLLMRFYGLEESSRDSFQSLYDQSIRQVIEKGIDKKALCAAIDSLEFLMSESSGSVPEGILHSIHIMEGWFYSKDVSAYVEYENSFVQLKQLVQTDYFENLLKVTFCENPHRIQICLVPFEEMKEEHQIDEKLNFIKKLDVEDLKEKLFDLGTVEKKEDTFIFWNTYIPNRQVFYLNLYFDVGAYPKKELGYVSLFCNLLGKFGTRSQSAESLNTEITAKIGQWSAYVDGYVHPDLPNEVKAKFVLRTSSLEHNISEIVPLIEKLLFKTSFLDGRQLRSELEQLKDQMKRNLTSNGIYYATQKVNAANSVLGRLRERLNGLSYYMFLCELLKDYSGNEKKIIRELERIQLYIKQKGHLIVSYAGGKQNEEIILKSLRSSVISLTVRDEESIYDDWDFTRQREGFIIPGSSCYNAWGRIKPYSGDALIAARVLSLGYLWKEVRDKNGAYGVGVKANESGVWNANSYRDPELWKTIEIFRNMDVYIRELENESEIVQECKLGMIENYHRSLCMADKIVNSDRDRISGMNEEFHQRMIEQMRNTSLESLKKFMNHNKDEEFFCCMGPEKLVMDAKNQFDKVTFLE